MTIFLESPLPILFIALAAVAVLGGVFLSNRRVVFLAIMGGVLAVALLGVLVERLVVTEREEVEMTLDNLAAALEADDPDVEAKTARVLEFLSPSATETRARAEWALSRFTVTRASVRNLEVRINDLTSPPSAECEFDGVVTIADRKGQLPTQSYPIHFTANFHKEGDRWLLMEHTEELQRYGRLHGE